MGKFQIFLLSEFYSEIVMGRQASSFKLCFIILLMHTITCLQSFKSMMALFQTSCPQGWTQLSFNSQYIRIAGIKPLLQRGGQSNVTLTVENLPQHSHSYNTIPLPGDSGWSHITSGLARHNSFYQKFQTSSTGNGVPFNIQPPYIAFNLCQLNEDLSVTVTNQNYNCDACNNASLISDVKNQNLLIVQLQNKIDNLTSNLLNLQTIVNANSQALKSSNSSIAQLQGKTDTLTLSLTNLQNNVTQVQKSSSISIAQLQTKTDILSSNLTTLQSTLNTNSDSLKASNALISSLQVSISANSEALKSFNTSIVQIQGKTDALSTSFTSLQGSVNANTQGLKSLNIQQQSKTQTLSTSIVSIQAKVNVNSQALRSTNTEFIQLEARISNLQTFFNIPPPTKTKTNTSSTSTSSNQNLFVWVIFSLALSLVAVVVAVSLPVCFRCCQCCNKRENNYVTNQSARN